jgi:helicase MOV-10
MFKKFEGSLCLVMDSFGDEWDEERSTILDKGEISFIDYGDYKSVCSYNTIEEGPIVISAPFALVEGQPQSITVGETAADSVTIKNTTGDAVNLWSVRIFASNPENSFKLSLIKPPSANETTSGYVDFFSLEDRMLQPGQTLTIWLSCEPKEIGLHTSVVYFDVESEWIERVAFLMVDDKISQSLVSRKPYSRGRRKKQFVDDSPFVTGVRPAKATYRVFRNRRPRYDIRLPGYDIPEKIRELLESKQVPDVVQEGVTMDNYSSFFEKLVIMEEMQLEVTSYL